ncbi:MAG: hypothetical protein M3Z24_10755, partial [Chloroflexota bacterium]|nr:hypothetical protein [Chloroflexota bacterium]
ASATLALNALCHATGRGLNNPRIAQRACGRAHPEWRSDSRSELGGDPVRERSSSGIRSQTGRRGGKARKTGDEVPLGAAKGSEMKETGGWEARD